VIHSSFPSLICFILRLRIGTGRGALVWALLLAVLPASSDQQGNSERPDVVVLVQSGFGYRDTVSINYSDKVTDQQVRKDVQSLIDTARWTVSEAQISTEDTNVPDSQASTSVSFQTDQIVSQSVGLYPLEPFILALKRYKTIQVTYFLRESVDFRGLRDYDNKYVTVSYQSPATYLVTVKRQDFERLDLPLTPPKKPEAVEKKRSDTKTGLIVILAVLCGIIAYCIAALYSKSHRDVSGENHR